MDQMKKNVKKGIVVACLAATLIGVCYYVAKPRATRSKQDEVQQIVEPTRESQGEPETKTTTTEETNKVENTQPQIESYNDSIAPTHESEGATTATTTTGSNTNKVVAEDNSKAVEKANEEIREAESNGAVIVEDDVTGVTAVTETQPAAEEKGETQQRVDLDFSSAVDATNEK